MKTAIFQFPSRKKAEEFINLLDPYVSHAKSRKGTKYLVAVRY